jgi:Rhodopirellula transposase DDE domain
MAIEGKRGQAPVVDCKAQSSAQEAKSNNVSLCTSDRFRRGRAGGISIDRRLFCLIAKNWRGRPLTSHQNIMELTKDTITDKALTVRG